MRVPILASACLAIGLIAIAPDPAAATDARRTVAESELPEWQAVGRLNVTGQGYCTATLIAADTVLTAAHCVMDRRRGGTVAPERILFLAGFRTGTYTAHAVADAVIVTPGFDRDARNVAADLALVILETALPAGVRPLPVVYGVRADLPLTLLSYGIDRSQVLSVQSGCNITGRLARVLYTDCEGVPGVSGAPILQPMEDRLAITGVASAIVRPRRGGEMRGDVLASTASRERIETLRRPPGLPGLAAQVPVHAP